MNTPDDFSASEEERLDSTSALDVLSKILDCPTVSLLAQIPRFKNFHGKIAVHTMPKLGDAEHKQIIVVAYDAHVPIIKVFCYVITVEKDNHFSVNEMNVAYIS